MPVKNRANNETGRLRLAHRCPNCGAACVVRDSSQKSAFSREYYLRCTDPICGWNGVGVFEIIRTIKAPHPEYTFAKLPQPVDSEFFQQAKQRRASADGTPSLL